MGHSFYHPAGTARRFLRFGVDEEGEGEYNRGTNVRINENKEGKMAFGCVLYLKAECDGCGLCEREGDEE